MIDFIYSIYNFLNYITLGKFLRIFWFFFIFDFLRYTLFDIIILITKKAHKNSFAIEKAKKELFAQKPLVSIIVPGKNEGKHIPKLIESLENQTYKNFEIIIIDDGSDDDTYQICSYLYSIGKIDKYLRNEIRGGKASAANFGLRFADGEYIIHLDADSYLEFDAIENIIIPFFMDKKIGAVGGDIRVANYNENILTSLQAIEYIKSISIGREVTSFLGILRVISGAFGAFRKDILNRIGGWDIGPGLDGDITIRIRKLGAKVTFTSSAICYTNVPTNIKSLTKQRYRWDRSLIRFRLRRHRDILMPDEHFNPLNFLTFLDNIWFNLIMTINFWIYMFDIFNNFLSYINIIFVVNYFLYLFTDIIQFVVALSVIPRSFKFFNLIIYIPLLPFYMGIYLRIIRTYAYFMEFFFKASYKDPWNPWKVSKKVVEVDFQNK